MFGTTDAVRGTERLKQASAACEDFAERVFRVLRGHEEHADER